MNLRQSILDALQKEPTLTNKQLYNLNPKGNRTSIRVYANEVRNKTNSGITPKNNHNSTLKPSKPSPPQETATFIDDPNELLMSVAVRELNKPDPDPRWANILISCKKENITIKNEMLDQFKQLPTKALVSLLNKNLQDEPL
jgi:hypothetical protein